MMAWRTIWMETRSESGPRESTRDETTSSCGGAVPGMLKPVEHLIEVRARDEDRGRASG